MRFFFFFSKFMTVEGFQKISISKATCYDTALWLQLYHYTIPPTILPEGKSFNLQNYLSCIRLAWLPYW